MATKGPIDKREFFVLTKALVLRFGPDSHPLDRSIDEFHANVIDLLRRVDEFGENLANWFPAYNDLPEDSLVAIVDKPPTK